MVRTPDGAIVLDPTGRAPGRGAYVCTDAACQAAAIAKGVLRRALAVPIPVGLFDPARVAGAPAPTNHNLNYQEGGA